MVFRGEGGEVAEMETEISASKNERSSASATVHSPVPLTMVGGFFPGVRTQAVLSLEKRAWPAGRRRLLDLPPFPLLFDLDDDALAPGAHHHQPGPSHVPGEHQKAQREARAERAQFFGRKPRATLHLRHAIVTAVQAQPVGSPRPLVSARPSVGPGRRLSSSGQNS